MKCEMNIIKEQEIILKRKLLLFIILGIALVFGMISIRYEFEMGICLALLLLVCTLVYILKMRKKLSLIEKEFRKLYTDIYYNVKELLHYEISSYFKINNFILTF